MDRRGVLWLAGCGAALLIAVGAVVFLRGTATQRPPLPAAVSIPLPPATTPAAPPPAAAMLAPPSFDIVSVDRRGQAVIAGRAAAGDRITVLDGGKSLGEVTADARGEWVLLPPAPLAPGNRQLTLQAHAPDGGAVRRSTETVALSVAPPASGKAAAASLAVLLPGDANQPARLLQRPEGVATEGKLGLDSVEYGGGDRLTLTGHAAPGARVAIHAGDQPLGTVTADAAGQWSLTAPYRPPAGGAQLRLDELAADGNVAHQVAAPLAAAAPAAGGSYVVARGNSLWLIARRVYGSGMRYTAIYRANHAEIRDPDRIYPGQHFSLPKP
jgi:nucleoid-associated protein YgaU